MFDVGADERCETKGERSCQQNTTPHRETAPARQSVPEMGGFSTRWSEQENVGENVIENERRFLLRRPTFPSEIAVMPSKWGNADFVPQKVPAGHKYQMNPDPLL